MTDTPEKKTKIIELYKKGLTVRAIQAELGMSSPSLVHWYIKKWRRDGNNGTMRIPLGRIRELLPKERKPILEKDEYDKSSSLLSAGWNSYRRELLKILQGVEDSQK